METTQDIDIAQLFRERRQNLPPELTEVIDNGVLDALLIVLQERFGLSEEQKMLLNNEVILILFLFLPLQGLVERIGESLEIEKNIAQSIYEELYSLVFEDIEEVLNHVDEASKNQPKKASSEAQVTPAASTEPFTPPSSDALRQLRTMSSDIERIHGYGYKKPVEEGLTNSKEEPIVRSSSQDDLLKR